MLPTYIQCIGIKVGSIHMSYHDYTQRPEVMLLGNELWIMYQHDLEPIPLYYNFTSEWGSNERIEYKSKPNQPTLLKVNNIDLSDEYSSASIWYDFPYSQIHDFYHKYLYDIVYALEFNHSRPAQSHYSGIDGISPLKAWGIVVVVILCFISWSYLIIKALKYVD
jgi:hypothetical protein